MIEKRELLGLMICPACRSKLASFTGCNACGIAFAYTDGIPLILQTTSTRTVTFQFTPERAVVGDRGTTDSRQS